MPKTVRSVLVFPALVAALSFSGCSGVSSGVADAPEQPAPELSKAERDAEAKYSKSTRSN